MENLIQNPLSRLPLNLGVSMIKVISTCNKNVNSFWNKKDENGKVVKGENKVSRKGWVQYVEITTLPNGKKVSVTKHGPKPV